MTNTTQHTPWTIPGIYKNGTWPSDYKKVCIMAGGEYGEIVAEVPRSAHCTEYAARIVSCVNACEGINPDAVPEMLEALKYVAKRMSAGDPLGDSLKVIDYALSKAGGRS